MTEEEMAALRRYQPAEVVRLLIPAERLETWVQDNRVPYQCAGVERGVWFTAEDIRRIGQLLPELMGGRRGGRRTRTSDAQQTPAGQSRPDLSAETLASWAQLSAHHRTPRRSTPGRAEA